MPITAGANHFLIFDENNQNSITDTTYSNNDQRQNGFTSGVARSDVFNKSLRQATVMASAIGEILKEKGYSVSDTTDFATLVGYIKSAFNIS